MKIGGAVDKILESAVTNYFGVSMRTISNLVASIGVALDPSTLDTRGAPNSRLLLSSGSDGFSAVLGRLDRLCSVARVRLNSCCPQ